jgi:hypothetical protein
VAELDYAQVMERWEWLDNDSGLRELQERDRTKWAPLFQQSYKQELPSHMSRGITVAMPSPRLIDMVDGLGADMASYKSIVTVQALGKDGPPNEVDKKRADKVERALSIIRNTFNEGGKLRREMLHLQLVGCFFAAELHVKDAAKSNMPWSVEFPDRLSVKFPVKGSPLRPVMAGRKYKQPVREAEKRYSQMPRTKRYKDNLTRKNGAWKWEPIADDVNVQDGLSRQGGDAKYGEEAEFLRYDDGEYIYHIALNDDGKGGEVVYCEPNLTGGCSTLIVCGSPTPYREPKERLGPALKPVMQTVLNRNLLTSIRATRGLNAKPDLTVEMTPEAFESAKDAGMLQQVQMAEGVPNMVYVGGKATPWALMPDPDLDALAVQWREEEMEYVSAWKEPTDPDTVGDARANTYLTAVEAIRRRQTPLLKDGDWLETNLLKMVIESIRRLGREFHLVATSDMALSKGEMSAGTAITIGPADLDFEFEVNVTTKAQTESELRARHDYGMIKVADGTGTLEEVIELEYVDSTAQIQRLAIDAGYRLQKATMIMYADAAWRDIVKTEAGILLPVAGDTMVQESPSSPGGITPMQPAAVASPEGGVAA